MLKKPLKSRFKPNLNTFTIAFSAIAFIALTMFMIWPPKHGPGYSADLAKVERPVSMRKALREDALIVGVQKDGSIFFGAEKISIERLPTLIQKGVAAGSEQKVYIVADARAKFGSVNEVLDGIRASGIENIAFLVEQRKPVTPLQAAVGVSN